VKIKITEAKRVTHFAVVLALVSSLLSFLATPSNAVAPNPCVTKTTRIGSDTVVQFLRTGTCTWTIPSDVTQLRGLIVGGGGGGGGQGLFGGGGGGGGYVEFDSLLLSNRTVTITVGTGGQSDLNVNFGASGSASSGGNSSIVGDGLNITALGGGAGGAFLEPNFSTGSLARAGGSGGGAGRRYLNENDADLSYGQATTALDLVLPGGQTELSINFQEKGNDGSPFCVTIGGTSIQFPSSAGGGGGAGGPGFCEFNQFGASVSHGGNGYQNNILGGNQYWAGGGGGGNFGYQTNIYSGGNGGLGGGGGGGAFGEQFDPQPISGIDGGSGLNLPTRRNNFQNYSQFPNGFGGDGGANTGGGGGGGAHPIGLGGNGGSGIVVLRYSTPVNAPAPSSDSTLSSATIKGVAVTSLGTGSTNVGSVVAGSVTLPDSVLASSGTTSFMASAQNIPGVPEANVKAVLLTSNENILATFNSSEEYSGGTITPGSFFVVKVISQDGAATKYYRINITITDATAPIISIDPPDLYVGNGIYYLAESDVANLGLPIATATDNVDGALSAPALTYATNGSAGCVEISNLATVKTCLNTVGNYVDFIFTAQDAAANSATQTLRIKSVPGDSPILTYREPILKGDNEPEIRLDISGLYQYAGISNNYTEDETEDGDFSNQEFYINTFETGLKVKRINTTDDGDVHIFFYGPATGPGRVTVQAYAQAFLHSFPEEDSNVLSIPIICDGATVACEVGDTGPGGGTIFYVESNPAGFASDAPECTAGCKYLEAAATSGSEIWYDFGIEEDGFKWSGNVTDHASITDTEIGSGYKNSLEIIAIARGGTAGAASAARGYLGGGKSDWYLPSLKELEQLHSSNVASIDGAYWSSSEEPCSIEISIDCASKAQATGGSAGEYESGGNPKVQLNKVRPIRAFGAIENPSSLFRNWQTPLAAISNGGPKAGETVYASAFERALPRTLYKNESNYRTDVANYPTPEEYVYRITKLQNSRDSSVDHQSSSGYDSLDSAAQLEWYERLGFGEAGENYQFTWKAFMCVNQAETAITKPTGLSLSYASREDGVVPGIPDISIDSFNAAHNLMFKNAAIDWHQSAHLQGFRTAVGKYWGNGDLTSRNFLGDSDPSFYTHIWGLLDVNGSCGAGSSLQALTILESAAVDAVAITTKSFVIPEQLNLDYLGIKFPISSAGATLGVTGAGGPSRRDFNAALWGLTTIAETSEPPPAPPALPIRREPTPEPTPTPAPTPPPAPTPAPDVTTNLQPSTEMLKVGTVYMSTGSYFLNNATKISLRKFTREVKASDKKVVLVYGYTDNRGGVNNTWLSRQRAKAVANYIRPMLKGKKIVIGWYASGKPVSTGTTAAALALNRRVEIYTK